jgi:hypothetical protein
VATAAPRELDRELADAARGGVQEHHVAGAHAGHEVDQPPGGQALDGDGGHGRERHGVGEVQQLVDRHRRQLGVGAAAAARVVGDAGAGVGSGRVARVSTSGGPKRVTWIARTWSA